MVLGMRPNIPLFHNMVKRYLQGMHLSDAITEIYVLEQRRLTMHPSRRYMLRSKGKIYAFSAYTWPLLEACGWLWVIEWWQRNISIILQLLQKTQ